MNAEQVKKEIRDVKDFPIKGILFRDFTTAFKNPECIHWFKEEICNYYKDKGITKVVGIESRGFFVATIVADAMNIGFVPIRKKGKLPADVYEESYEKEYGIDIIQIHKDAITPDDVVLLHDDLLATGGTTEASVKLLKKIGVKKIYLNFLAELDDLNGREKIDTDVDVYSLIHY